MHMNKALLPLGLTALLIGCAASFPSTARAQTACDILSEGNAHITEKKTHDAALIIFTKAENIDPFKKGDFSAPAQQPCLDGVYATIGTLHTLKGEDAAAAGDTAAASLHFREAARYNRMFAVTAMCIRGECEGVKDYWTRQTQHPLHHGAY